MPSGSRSTPRSALATIFLVVFMDLLGFGIIIPQLPFYVPHFQQNPFKVTLLFSIYSICQFIGAPVLGLISDRFGRRPVLGLSQAGSAVGYLILALASYYQMPNAQAALALVYLSRIIDGFTGGNISTAQAFIGDVTTPENRARGMALVGVAFGIGFSAGPFLGGVLGAIHISLPAYVAAACSAAAAVMSFLYLPETRAKAPVEAEVWLHPRAFAPVLRNNALLQFLLISFVTMSAFVMMEATVGLFLNFRFGYEQKQIGWFFAFAGLCIIIVQGGFIGRLIKLFGEWPLAILGPFLVAVGMLGYAYVGFHRSLGLLLVAAAINATGRSLQMPTVSSLISKFAGPGLQGIAFGMYHGLGSLARFCGPIVAGLVYTRLNHTGAFVTAAVVVSVGAVWTLILHLTTRTPQREPEPQALVPDA